MKINWKVRMKNPYFWIGLLGVILAAMDVTPEMFTSWAVLVAQGKALFGNPYLLGSVVVAVLGVVFDPTTKGISDSDQAMTYQKPKE